MISIPHIKMSMVWSHVAHVPNGPDELFANLPFAAHVPKISKAQWPPSTRFQCWRWWLEPVVKRDENFGQELWVCLFFCSSSKQLEKFNKFDKNKKIEVQVQVNEPNFSWVQLNWTWDKLRTSKVSGLGIHGSQGCDISLSFEIGATLRPDGFKKSHQSWYLPIFAKHLV